MLPIALHLDRPKRARALYVLRLALGPLGPAERYRLDDLHSLVQEALAHPEITGRAARNPRGAPPGADATRRLQPDSPAARRVGTAPLGYLLPPTRRRSPARPA